MGLKPRPPAPARTPARAPRRSGPARIPAATRGGAGAAATVEGYLAAIPGELGEVAARLRTLIREAAPSAEERIKWAQPVYEENGPFAYLRAARRHVTFGFWRG